MEIKEIEEEEPFYIKRARKRINALYEECSHTTDLAEQKRIYSGIRKLVEAIVFYKATRNPPLLIKGTKEEIEQALELIRNDKKN